MGGILSADAVLLPPYSPENRDPFYHRILGTINFDTPFLGMHPGVIKSGIGSIFRPAPPNARPGPENHASNENVFLPMHSEGGSQVSTLALSTVSSPPSSPYTTPTDDPNYNPPFANDVHIPVRKRWNNALHFLNKHSDDLAHAAKTYVTSHFEFGGAMADYRTLNNRYKKLRGLEDIDDSRGVISSSYRQVRRVRFVNYYTACTGRLKGKATEKDKKFCMLPERGSGGEIDPTWVRVFMEGCDEVGAHCGLFFPENPHYEKLVVDVGHKVQEWIILNR
ncbi:MAG: hypothetical protein MMC23_001803 [Stictis urceolatum]|nr:hypothetical protein [Stictis urceolata]